MRGTKHRITAGQRLPVAIFTLCAALVFNTAVAAEQDGTNGFRGALLNAEMATGTRLQQLRSAGYTAIVLLLSGSDESSVVADRRAVEEIHRVGLELHYWIEVARCAQLADRHPLWMASLQGHSEWRRLHSDVPQPGGDEVVKVYPWTPVLYREAFEAHLSRIQRLLDDLPRADSIFLNDLQGAPSACGCGNPVCRWTADYGPIRTATPLGDDAPADFVARVKRFVPHGTRVIPVWTTECEEHDKADDGLCAGVGCYIGICWKAYSRQLKPLAVECEMLGVLLLSREFGQSATQYPGELGWIGHALKHGFSEQPPKYGGTEIPASRLIAVLQGWDVNEAELHGEIEQARAAGAAGFIVTFARIDQSWQPRLVKWK